MYGKEIFDESMIRKINDMMMEQYNQEVWDWMEVILSRKHITP